MPHGFSTYYTQNKRDAGVYTYSLSNSKWSYAPLGGTP
jgi:hypothetical protein